MRVLIVGCGYVGLPLGAELVRQGHEVFGLRRSESAKTELEVVGIKPLLADITKPEELNKLPRDFDWVVNCVASSGGGAEDYRNVYLEGTRNLIQWLAGENAVRKFVYTSSTSVYGQTDASVVDETSLAEPVAETSRVLVETEDVLLGAWRTKGFPALVLRVAGIYGPERGHWFKQFLKGEARMEGKGERFLNMIHRDDVIGCIIAALKNGQPGKIYNAVDDEPVAQADFFSWMAATLGKPMPESTAENANASRKRGVTNKRVSNCKLKKELSFHFRYPSFRQGYEAEMGGLVKKKR